MDECDDSPLVTCQSLTQSGCAYQIVIRSYLENNSFEKVGITWIHEAIRDIIVSDDDVAHEALDYLFSAGAPTMHFEGTMPFAYLAAMQWTKPNYVANLIILASYDMNFQDIYNETSAYNIVETRCPGAMNLIIEKILLLKVSLSF